jgi:hypothetical protein
MDASATVIDSLFERFPELPEVVGRINQAGVLWGIGGSAALYASGHKRFPHDIDVIFTAKGHDRVDKLFGIRSGQIETDAYETRKSAPGTGPISFLSNYEIKADGRRAHYELTPEMIERRESAAGPVCVLRPEVVVVAKLLLKRTGKQKQDLRDALEAAKVRPLDAAYTRELAVRIGASEAIKEVIGS